ncbi:restriction endonuclease subunit S [Ruminococcus flavefaciens]|uniref:Type I restriction enzyme, S subunit n=1 Tax=Ruminococcus flavefaciens TaxID=1265 RepID=A0A1K1MY62_RUMFL|nr:restriction endonuclease subunit S [Ruminococcus flavefaciens]SFW28112.1 type I restriction enzyme, S subunit [Ruminococcus flavefaciens]
MAKIAFLEDVCDILDSQRVPVTAKDRTKGIYPYYGANGIQDYVDDYIFDDELVLLAEDGGNFGSKDRPIAYRVSGKCWVNNHAHVLKAKDCIDVDYLCYSIMFYDVSSMVNGATRQKLNQATMRKMLIPLPSIERQLEIVANLDKATHTIDLCNAILEKLDLLVKSRFVEMFGEPSANPNKFAIVPFENVVQYMGDIGSNGANKVVVEHLNMKDEEDYALMVRFLNFTKNDFSQDVKYISKESYDFFKKSQIFGGELVFCKIGSAGLNYVMPYLNRPVSLGLNQIMVRINDKILMPYLYQYLHTEYGELLISGCINGAVTKSITKTELKKIPLMLPPINLQQQFAAFVEQTDKSKLAVKQVLEKAETLKKALMQEYFG